METTTDPPLLLNLDEVAQQLRCTRRSVERQVANQSLRVARIGRSVRVERRELETFIAAHREPDDGR
jgi:excisionase family DNA binding protein